MRIPRTETIVVTRDAALAHVTSLASPPESTTWCRGFGSALTAMNTRTNLLVVDAALDGPMARLLATVFVDRMPSRRAIIVQGPGGVPVHRTDERVTTLSWPASLEGLADAVGNGAPWTGQLDVAGPTQGALAA
jgi:hypothetical protein